MQIPLAINACNFLKERERERECVCVCVCVTFNEKNFFNYLFIFGCVGSSFLCEGFLQLRQVGVTLHRGAQASHYRSLSCCGAQAPDAQAQQLWLTGLVALQHVGSSQTRARTRVPCIGRQIPNHCTTREALKFFYLVRDGVYYAHSIPFYCSFMKSSTHFA